MKRLKRIWLALWCGLTGKCSPDLDGALPIDKGLLAWVRVDGTTIIGEAFHVSAVRDDAGDTTGRVLRIQYKPIGAPPMTYAKVTILLAAPGATYTAFEESVCS